MLTLAPETAAHRTQLTAIDPAPYLAAGLFTQTPGGPAWNQRALRAFLDHLATAHGTSLALFPDDRPLRRIRRQYQGAHPFATHLMPHDEAAFLRAAVPFHQQAHAHTDHPL